MPRTAVRVPTSLNPDGEFICDCCGIRFDRHRTHVNATRSPRYCSPECVDRSLAECWNCGAICKVLTYRMHERAPSCSYSCAMALRGGTPLPDDHWARWYGKSSPWTPPPTPAPRARFVSVECADCGEWFIGDRWQGFNMAGQDHQYCSKLCSARASRRRRRAREYGAPGDLRWMEVMRLFVQVFDKRCAYCDQPITGQPDPDHVMALSRGGRNDIGNVVPACRPCNADKRDLTLDEWRVDRRRRALPPVRYDLARDDPRFRHLTA